MKIAVIGAGIAGLSCARHLQAAGLSVEVFEKSRGPGGRCSTRRGDDWQADHGAQYFTARDARFRALVARLRADGVVAPWEAHIVSIAPDGSCAPLSSTTERFVGTPRMSAIGRWLAEGLAVHYETRVEALLADPAGWRLLTSGEPAGPYAAVVLSLPAAQSSALLSEVAPELSGISAGCEMESCHALIARYASDPGLPFDAAFINTGMLSWVARDSSKPGRPAGHTWVLHAPASAAAFNVPAEQVIEDMLEAFGRLGAPCPDELTLHRWRFARNVAGDDRGALWAPASRLGLAGDWLHGGRIEGAWLSGLQLAERLLAAPPATLAQRSNSTP